MTPQPSVTAAFHRTRVHFLAVVALVVATTASFAGNESRFTGFITSIDAVERSMVVGFTTVLTNGQTEFEDLNSNPISFDVFQVGDLVDVRGQLQSENTVLAERIELDDEFSGGDVEFDYRVNALVTALNLDGGTIGLGGQSFAIDAMTVVEDGNDQHIFLADILLNDFAEARIQIMTPPALDRVAKIEVRRGVITPGGQIEFRGLITDLDAGAQTMIVFGRFVQTTGSTEFLDDDNNAIGFGGFAIGDFVEVEGSINPSGLVTASKIKHEDFFAAGFEIALFGTIDAQNGNAWTVRGLPILIVPGETNFRDPQGNDIASSLFMVGSRVLVELVLVPGGTPIADKLVLFTEGTPGDDAFATLVGPIEALGDGAQPFTVAGTAVTTSMATLFLDAAGMPILFADLAVGQVVRVFGFFAPDGSVSASILQVLGASGPPADIGRLNGRIASIDAGLMTFVVDSTTVAVTPGTEIEGRHGRRLAFADLAVGQFVNVIGTLLSDGTLLAGNVHVHEENEGPVEGESTTDHVSVIDATSFVADDKTFTVDGATTFTNWDGAAATFGDLAVGSYAHVVGLGQVSPFTARTVQILPNVIAEINRGDRKVISFREDIFVDGATTITNTDGMPLAFEDLLIGDSFLLEATLGPGTSFTATSIALIGRPVLNGSGFGLVPTVNTTNNGVPTITTTENTNTFGFVSLPDNAFNAVENTAYLISAHLTSDLVNPFNVPTIRLRVNQRDFEKGTIFALNPGNTGSVMPGPAGRDYTFLFVPTGEQRLIVGHEESWFVSLDVLSVGGQGLAGASVTLDKLSIARIPIKSIGVNQELAREKFSVGTEGWREGGAAGFFTRTVGNSGLDGALSLITPDNNTFGFWSKSFPITLQPGATYRGRFFVRTSVTDPSSVPQFRLRLNTSAYQLGTEVVIVATGDILATAKGEVEVYDAYLTVPANYIADGETLIVSFDLMNFDATKALNSPVSLDEFVLEEVNADDPNVP